MSGIFDLLRQAMTENGERQDPPAERSETLFVDLAPAPTPKGYFALQKTGRRSNGPNGDRGRVVHAVLPNGWAAFCGTTPSGAADWSCTESPEVTCKRCLKLIPAFLEARK